MYKLLYPHSLFQVGLLFYICIFWTSSSLFGAVYVFPFEKVYLVKERKADMYRLSVYYACSTLCDMVAHVFYPTFFMLILYFMAGFKRTVPCFFLTLFTILLIAVISQVSRALPDIRLLLEVESSSCSLTKLMKSSLPKSKN